MGRVRRGRRAHGPDHRRPHRTSPSDGRLVPRNGGRTRVRGARLLPRAYVREGRAIAVARPLSSFSAPEQRAILALVALASSPARATRPTPAGDPGRAGRTP